MSASLMPFLFQTRTLQRVCRAPIRTSFVQGIQPHRRGYASRKREDNSIPFDWGGQAPPETYTETPDGEEEPVLTRPDTTITPTEAFVFKSIFDEIAQGKMPSRQKRRHQDRDADAKTGARSHSIVEQARMNEFRDNVLSRFPEDLRNAAHVALGLFELKSGSEFVEMNEETEEQHAERVKYERVREAEKVRVDKLMKACKTDVALWKVMEEEVFSLPEKLGIQAVALLKKTKKNVKRAVQEKAVEDKSAKDQKRSMDVHGPLYAHFLNNGLDLFDSAFRRPSSFAFQILPRVKALGLPSYVLGVSSPFYAALARMHWDRYGDASAALDVIQEMNRTGLYANEDVQDLLFRIRTDIQVCSYDVQGPLVSAMMEAPPYDGALVQKLDDLEKFAEHTVSQAENDYSS